LALLRLLDNRFNVGCTATSQVPCAAPPHPSDAAAALVVTQTELYVHSLLCLAAYVGLQKRAAWQHELQIAALAFQLLGAIVFVGSELLTGCLNMVPIGEHTCAPGVSLYELFYFWFGVSANFVWVVIPLRMAAGVITRPRK
jgi:hypothetical protein